MQPPEKLAWKAQERSGLSASQFGMALGFCGRVSDFVQYLRQHVGTALEFTGNEATLHGNRTEAKARSCYELATGHAVGPGRFFTTPDRVLACSPDGIVRLPQPAATDTGTSGSVGGGGCCGSTAEAAPPPPPPPPPSRRRRLLEIKCPFYALFDGSKQGYRPFGIPQHYLCQMQGQMAIAGAAECDFMAFLDANGRQDVAQETQVVIWRVHRCEAFWAWAEPKLRAVAAWVAEGLPDGIDRSFAFDPFEFSQIVVEPLVFPFNITAGLAVADEKRFAFFFRSCPDARYWPVTEALRQEAAVAFFGGERALAVGDRLCLLPAQDSTSPSPSSATAAPPTVETFTVADYDWERGVVLLHPGEQPARTNAGTAPQSNVRTTLGSTTVSQSNESDEAGDNDGSAAEHESCLVELCFADAAMMRRVSVPALRPARTPPPPLAIGTTPKGSILAPPPLTGGSLKASIIGSGSLVATPLLPMAPAGGGCGGGFGAVPAAPTAMVPLIAIRTFQAQRTPLPTYPPQQQEPLQPASSAEGSGPAGGDGKESGGPMASRAPSSILSAALDTPFEEEDCDGGDTGNRPAPPTLSQEDRQRSAAALAALRRQQPLAGGLHGFVTAFVAEDGDARASRIRLVDHGAAATVLALGGFACRLAEVTCAPVAVLTGLAEAARSPLSAMDSSVDPGPDVFDVDAAPPPLPPMDGLASLPSVSSLVRSPSAAEVPVRLPPTVFGARLGAGALLPSEAVVAVGLQPPTAALAAAGVCWVQMSWEVFSRKLLRAVVRFNESILASTADATAEYGGCAADLITASSSSLLGA